MFPCCSHWLLSWKYLISKSHEIRGEWKCGIGELLAVRPLVDRGEEFFREHNRWEGKRERKNQCWNWFGLSTLHLICSEKLTTHSWLSDKPLASLLQYIQVWRQTWQCPQSRGQDIPVAILIPFSFRVINIPRIDPLWSFFVRCSILSTSCLELWLREIQSKELQADKVQLPPLPPFLSWAWAQ